MVDAGRARATHLATRSPSGVLRVINSVAWHNRSDTKKIDNSMIPLVMALLPKYSSVNRVDWEERPTRFVTRGYPSMSHAVRSEM